MNYEIFVAIRWGAWKETDWVSWSKSWPNESETAPELLNNRLRWLRDNRRRFYIQWN
jgi:hypothetical protein